MEKYDCLIIGATAFGLGAAQAFKKRNLRALIVEKSILSVYEYGESMKKATGDLFYTPKTVLAREFKGKLDEKNKQFDEDFTYYLISPALLGLCGGTEIYYSAVITDIFQENGYTIEFISCGKKVKICAGSILDTTSRFDTAAFFGEKKPKYSASLNAVAFDKNGQFKVYSTKFSGDFTGARERLLNSVPEGFKTAKIAFKPDYIVLESGRYYGTLNWIPSVKYGNAVAAVDEGYIFGEKYTVSGNYLNTSNTKITDAGSYDVIVCGLGTAGVITACITAKNGYKTLGLEALDCAGGTATVGGIFNDYFGIPGGAYTKILSGEDCKSSVFSSGLTETVKFDKALENKNIDARFGVMVTGVIKNGNRVTGVEFVSDSKKYMATAKYVVDATGNGYVAEAAGCKMQYGRNEDSIYQPYSNVQMF